MNSNNHNAPGAEEPNITNQNNRISGGPSKEKLQAQRKVTISVTIGALVLLSAVIGFIIFLLQPSTPTNKIRDILIIFMALETLLIGLVLVILIVQVARLINLLQNEIKPMLKTTNDSVNTLRGTVFFISDNIAEPIMKLNEYFAAFRQFGEFVRFAGKKKK